MDCIIFQYELLGKKKPVAYRLLCKVSHRQQSLGLVLEQGGRVRSSNIVNPPFGGEQCWQKKKMT